MSIELPASQKLLFPRVCSCTVGLPWFASDLQGLCLPCPAGNKFIGAVFSSLVKAKVVQNEWDFGEAFDEDVYWCSTSSRGMDLPSVPCCLPAPCRCLECPTVFQMALSVPAGWQLNLFLGPFSAVCIALDCIFSIMLRVVVSTHGPIREAFQNSREVPKETSVSCVICKPPDKAALSRTK